MTKIMQAAKDVPSWNWGLILYFLIGSLGASLVFCGEENGLPAEWKPWLAILNAGLLAVKAKISKGATDTKEEDNA